MARRTPLGNNQITSINEATSIRVVHHGNQPDFKHGSRTRGDCVCHAARLPLSARSQCQLRRRRPDKPQWDLEPTSGARHDLNTQCHDHTNSRQPKRPLAPFLDSETPNPIMMIFNYNFTIFFILNFNFSFYFIIIFNFTFAFWFASGSRCGSGTAG